MDYYFSRATVKIWLKPGRSGHVDLQLKQEAIEKRVSKQHGYTAFVAPPGAGGIYMHPVTKQAA